MGRGDQVISGVGDTQDHQGRITDFLSWPSLVGACGLVVFAGPSIQGGAGCGRRRSHGWLENP